MPRVSLKIIAYRVTVYKEARPVAQKKRKIGEEKHNATCKEVGKLVKVGLIQKAHYTNWLANVVMVKK